MSRAHEYRERAAAAEEMADRVRRPEAKDQFREIAAAWRVLALHVERLSLRDPSFVAPEDPYIRRDARVAEGQMDEGAGSTVEPDSPNVVGRDAAS